MSYLLKECNKEDYEVFKHISERAFGYNKDWFVRNYEHIFPKMNELDSKDAPAYNNNYILWDKEVAAGSIGVYPIDIISQGVSYKVAGIGTVGVLPECRGRGIMTKMLAEIDNILVEENYELSWLVGERLRYLRWGYDLGGMMLKVILDKKSFNHERWPNAKIDIPKKPDISVVEDLEEMYKKYKNRTLRSKIKWERHIRRKNLEWAYIPNKAYMVWDKSNPNEIFECAGDVDIVMNMVKLHFKENEISNLTINFPYEKNKLIKELTKYSKEYLVSPSGQWKVVDKKIKNSFRFANEILDEAKKTKPIYMNRLDYV